MQGSTMTRYGTGSSRRYLENELGHGTHGLLWAQASEPSIYRMIAGHSSWKEHKLKKFIQL